MEQCEGLSSGPHLISRQLSLQTSVVSCKVITGTALWPVLNRSLCSGSVSFTAETSSGPYNCSHYTVELSTGWNSINQVAQHESSADTWFSQYQCLQIVMRAINVRSHLEPLVYISAEKWALQYFALSWIIQSIRVPPIESPMLFLQESFFSLIALATICLSFGSYVNMCLRLSQSWAHV